jgi:hypothetical protein
MHNRLLQVINAVIVLFLLSFGVSDALAQSPAQKFNDDIVSKNSAWARPTKIRINFFNLLPAENPHPAFVYQIGVSPAFKDNSLLKRGVYTPQRYIGLFHAVIIDSIGWRILKAFEELKYASVSFNMFNSPRDDDGHVGRVTWDVSGKKSEGEVELESQYFLIENRDFNCALGVCGFRHFRIENTENKKISDLCRAMNFSSDDIDTNIAFCIHSTDRAFIQAIYHIDAKDGRLKTISSRMKNVPFLDKWPALDAMEIKR